MMNKKETEDKFCKIYKKLPTAQQYLKMLEQLIKIDGVEIKRHKTQNFICLKSLDYTYSEVYPNHTYTDYIKHTDPIYCQGDDIEECLLKCYIFLYNEFPKLELIGLS